MPDLFEGFRWREVIAVLLAFVFFIGIMIDTVRDLDTSIRSERIDADTRLREEATALRARVRELEVKQAQLWCAVNPETCMGNRASE